MLDIRNMDKADGRNGHHDHHHDFRSTILNEKRPCSIVLGLTIPGNSNVKFFIYVHMFKRYATKVRIGERDDSSFYIFRIMSMAVSL